MSVFASNLRSSQSPTTKSQSLPQIPHAATPTAPASSTHRILRRHRSDGPSAAVSVSMGVGKAPWHEGVASRMVDGTIERMAALHAFGAITWDAALFAVFDLDLAAAFAQRNLESVEALCRWYLELAMGNAPP